MDRLAPHGARDVVRHQPLQEGRSVGAGDGEHGAIAGQDEGGSGHAEAARLAADAGAFMGD